MQTTASSYAKILQFTSKPIMITEKILDLKVPSNINNNNIFGNLSPPLSNLH